jgi:hypothetical protein
MIGGVDDSRFRCALLTSDGASVRVGPQGLLIGREHGCDVLIADPAISRRHVLIRVGAEGAEIVPLGRVPVQLNGQTCSRPQALANGDRLQVADQTFVVEVDVPARSTPTTGYRLVRGGSSFAIAHTPFQVGGATTDDLTITGWPAGALRFHVAQNELFVEVLHGSAILGDQPVEAGTMEAIDVGDVFEYLDEKIAVVKASDRAHTTVAVSIHALPSKVTVELLPRGGRVVFTMPDGDHAVYLADRRLDLVMALLKPPSEYAPGEFIPDDVLRPMVWPRNPNVIRSEINVHITRCRKDLLGAGLPGPRSPGGGGTRLALATGCEVVFL